MLSKDELLNVNGGVNWTAMGIIGTIIVFVVGIIDGYMRPLKCNK